jgi:RNA-directed DNA polymerase
VKPSNILRKKFSFSRNELFSYALTCPYRYKTYPIDKRGSAEKRLISQPSKELKAIQRVLLEEFFEEHFKYHRCATAYKKGASILTNAKPHLRNRYLLKMDFQNFFPSIRDTDFSNYLLEKDILVELPERILVCLIFFKKFENGGVLSIGSPGSPAISNALLFEFDRELQRRCKEAGITYTRYSDDMTFSTNVKDILFDWPSVVEDVLNKLQYPKLSINEKKTVFSSKKFNRHVTGITISNDSHASLGREKKREIRTRVFLVKDNELSEKEMMSLKGYISFARSIEPKFVEALEKKYPEQMSSIKAKKNRSIQSRRTSPKRN